jgi:alcohol dehydrogenase
MLLASLLAAIAFSHSDVAAAHCLAEALGGLYDLPHGTCNAVALPVVMEYNLDCCEEKYARIARAMGLNFHDARNGSRLAVQAVRQLSRQIAVPDFNSMGVRREDFRTLARHSAANNSNPDNPRPMAEKDYVAILTTLSGSAVEPVP